MPVKWKSSKKFKPELVVARVAKTRSENEDGSTSFSDFQIHQDAATLYSMLDFPEVASETDRPSLVWAALFSARPKLTALTFIEAINVELNKRLRNKEEKFKFLATFSFNFDAWPKKISVLDMEIESYGISFPRKYRSRDELIARNAKNTGVPLSPNNYRALGVSVKAKSAEAAAHNALKAIDVFRGLLCLEGNMGMEANFGGTAYKPINVVRMGSFQTLHRADGASAKDAIWYEPAYREAKVYKFRNNPLVRKNVLYALRRIKRSKFGKDIVESLVRYVRALDDPDPNTAFLRLWGAFERLLTPGHADYQVLVDRCSFLYDDSDYHRQVLMHLREYRNASVHAGQETSQARTNCFLLQGYYRDVFWFLIGQSLNYGSLSEVHEFLSIPDDLVLLKHRRRLLDRAIRFLSP